MARPRQPRICSNCDRAAKARGLCDRHYSQARKRGTLGAEPRYHLRHGKPLMQSRTFRSWTSMLCRCTNPKHRYFNRYGGRGVAVCERWMLFDNFLADMGERPQGMSLDRIDNSGGYEPKNCRWATQREQHNNKSSNRHVVAFGQTKTISQWARDRGIGKSTIGERLSRGWDAESAVSLSPSQGQPLVKRLTTLRG